MQLEVLFLRHHRGHALADNAAGFHPRFHPVPSPRGPVEKPITLVDDGPTIEAGTRVVRIRNALATYPGGRSADREFDHWATDIVLAIKVPADVEVARGVRRNTRRQAHSGGRQHGLFGGPGGER